jgi:hypothetical protein
MMALNTVVQGYLTRARSQISGLKHSKDVVGEIQRIFDELERSMEALTIEEIGMENTLRKNRIR